MAVNCIHETVTYILASFNEPPHFQFSEALCKPFETLLSLQLCDADVQDQVSYLSVSPHLSVFHPPRSCLFSDRVFHLRAGRGVLLPDPVCSQIVCSICALVKASSSQIPSVLRSCVPSARWSRRPPRSSLFSDRVFHLRAGRGVLLPDPVCSQIVCSICALVEASSQILSVLRSCVPSARWSRHPPPRSCLFSDRVFHLRAGRGILLPDLVCSQIVCSICALVEASSSQIPSVLRSCVPSARWSRRPPPRSCPGGVRSSGRCVPSVCRTSPTRQSTPCVSATSPPSSTSLTRSSTCVTSASSRTLPSTASSVC